MIWHSLQVSIPWCRHWLKKFLKWSKYFQKDSSGNWKNWLISFLNLTVLWCGKFFFRNTLTKSSHDAMYWLGRLYNYFLALSLRAKLINLSFTASSVSCWSRIVVHTSSNSLIKMYAFSILVNFKIDISLWQSDTWGLGWPNWIAKVFKHPRFMFGFIHGGLKVYWTRCKVWIYSH